MNQNIEDTLLLFCLNIENEASKYSILAKYTDFEWNALVQQSIKHGVTPYLYHRLKSLQPAVAIPTDVEQRLKKIYFYYASRNIRLYHELGKVLTLLKIEGIPVVVLKGAHLAEAVYGNIALRQMCDVDLMVRKADLERTAEKLEKFGYRPSKPFWVESHCEMIQHLPPFLKAGATSIEIHHSLTNPNGPFNINADELWQRVGTAKIANLKVLVLSPEDLLLHLCLHTSYQHRFSFRLLAICDIFETLRSMKNEINPEQIAQRARLWKMERCALFTLFLMSELLKTTLADEILKALEPCLPDPGSVAWAREQIFSNRDSDNPISPSLARVWKARRFDYKIAAFLKYVFIPRRTMAALYPTSPDSLKIYFYYLVRVHDVFRRYRRTAWRLLLHDKKVESVVKSEDQGNSLEQWMTSGVDKNISVRSDLFTC